MDEPADVYLDLRSRALGVSPEQLDRPPVGTVLALLMETRYPEAVATLLGIADGTTSMYFSNGGGIIGGGEHDAVAAETARWIAEAERFVPDWAPTEGEPGLPRAGETQFVAVTVDGLLVAAAPEEDLGEGRHPAAPLFHAGHRVIAQLRLVDERSRGG